MSLTRYLAFLLGLAILAPATPAFAQEDDEDEEVDEEEEDVEEEEEAKPKAKKKKGKKAEPEEPFVKQNLSGHDLGTSKKENLFEKDRFFVDKVDTKQTSKGTLVQGSLSSSSLLYSETGGQFTGAPMGLPEEVTLNDARYSRLFTELRLQTDFRHIGGGSWDARADLRARVVNTPGETSALSVDPNRVQSGFRGTNEYDIRELWLFRSGKRTDFFLGRQFVPDLGGIKFDGLRFDYASSRKLTFIGFGGLYPMRGSRSITTDYPELRTREYEPAGRLVGAGGFGAAYRNDNMYGAIGGVALVPFQAEEPRVFITSTGYYRSGSAFDLYHFALVDLYSSQGAGLTNLSAGLNYKPNQRLRLTAAVNRVDVDTLAVQAYAYLSAPQDGGGAAGRVQNETYFRRLATNMARVGVSAGLGQFQRFEISTSVGYRYRNSITIPVTNGMGMPDVVPLQRARGVDVWGSITDRRSIFNMRLGADVTRTIGVGGEDSIAFMRSNILSVRAFAARELKSGRGEWEADLSYTTTADSALGYDCSTVYTCYGSSEGSILQLAGHLYYRVNRDWFLLGTGALSRQTITSIPVDAMGNILPRAPDPSIIGLMAFFRAAYRF